MSKGVVHHHASLLLSLHIQVGLGAGERTCCDLADYPHPLLKQHIISATQISLFLYTEEREREKVRVGG